MFYFMLPSLGLSTLTSAAVGLGGSIAASRAQRNSMNQSLQQQRSLYQSQQNVMDSGYSNLGIASITSMPTVMGGGGAGTTGVYHGPIPAPVGARVAPDATPVVEDREKEMNVFLDQLLPGFKAPPVVLKEPT